MPAPTLFQRVFKFLTGIPAIFQGRQTPAIPYQSSFTNRLFNIADVDLDEIPFRDPTYARNLIATLQSSPEARTAIEIIKDYVFSSQVGDEYGFTIQPFKLDPLSDRIDPADQEVADIAMSCIARIASGLEFATAVERFLTWGDCFANIPIDFKNSQVAGIRFLPTWQCFRNETPEGDLTSFEQWLIPPNGLLNTDSVAADRNRIILHPLSMVHWRWDRKFKYGRSLFEASFRSGDFDKLDTATTDMQNASRNVGSPAMIHTMPIEKGEVYKKEYKADIEERLKLGAIFHYFVLQGAKVEQAGANSSSGQTNLKEGLDLWRRRIGMKSRVPSYLLFPESAMGGKDLSSQPALAFAVFIGSVRMILAQGIRQIIDTELALKGIDKGRWKYRIVFPAIATNPFQQPDPDLNAAGVADTSKANGNGNGNGKVKDLVGMSFTHF
jgi:hypothetical protein